MQDLILIQNLRKGLKFFRFLNEVICDKMPAPSNRLTLFYSDQTSDLSIPITVVWDKLWWRVIEPSTDSNGLAKEWSDHPLTIPAKFFKAASAAVLSIKLPGPRWCSKMLIGLSKKTTRSYKPLVHDEAVHINLRDFCDSPELETPGTIPITLECEIFGRRFVTSIGSVQVSRQCKVCHEESRNFTDALEHIAAEFTVLKCSHR